MKDCILEEMDKYGADGVDFVPLFTKPTDINLNIIVSYTREEWLHQSSYPKSGRLYWKMIDNKKVYLERN